MKAIRNVVLVLTVLTLFIVAGGYLLPRELDVSREITIQAPATEIFPYVGDLDQWAVWSPWTERDPDMAIRTSDPSTGVGASQHWSSESMGSGSATIIQWEENERIAYRMLFEGFEEAPATAAIVLTPEGEATRVTWSFEETLPQGVISGWVALMLNQALKTDFESGLENLKNVSEDGSE